jgi:tRNA G26 N,N-dimethylase Trm1
MHPDNPSRTYFVVVSRRGSGANPFGWEIQRRKQAMGVKVSGGGYRSHRAAQEAGSSALDIFLNDLSKEADVDR